VVNVRMPTPHALRERKGLHPRPAASADDTTLVRRERLLANHADAREQEVGESRRRGAYCGPHRALRETSDDVGDHYRVLARD